MQTVCGAHPSSFSVRTGVVVVRRPESETKHSAPPTSTTPSVRLYPFRVALRVWTICGKDFASRSCSEWTVVMDWVDCRNGVDGLSYWSGWTVVMEWMDCRNGLGGLS